LPVTLIVNVPLVVKRCVLTVSVEVPEGGTGLREKLPVANAGRPETESETVPVKPPCDETLTASP